MKKEYVKPVARRIEDGEIAYSLATSVVVAAATALAAAAVSKVFKEDFTSGITTNANNKVELIYE